MTRDRKNGEAKIKLAHTGPGETDNQEVGSEKEFIITGLPQVKLGLIIAPSTQIQTSHIPPLFPLSTNSSLPNSTKNMDSYIYPPQPKPD